MNTSSGLTLADAELAHRKRPASEAFDMSRFGTPHAAQGPKNIFIKLWFAPLPNQAHLKSRKGHPLFLYRPDRRLTGDDATDTVYGLPDVNYGLHQRVVYDEMRSQGVSDQMMPLEVLRYKEWPATVDEFLSERIIVPIGIRDQEPNDIRFEGQVLSVPTQVEGLAHGVPWIWGAVKSGDTVGFRLGEVEMNRSMFVDPDGKPITVTASRRVLQLTPMVLHSGAKYHGVGDGQSPQFELDFPQDVRVEEHERELNRFGLPLGPVRSETKRTIEYKTRGFGFFLTLGKVGLIMGRPPTPDGAKRAIRTYGGLNSAIATYNRLGIYVTPHSRLDRF